MKTHRLIKRIRPLAIALTGLSVSLAMGILPAAAADPSIPFRNADGFQCYSYNGKGECTNFSFFNTGGYGAMYPAAPAYPSSSYYPPTTYAPTISYPPAAYAPSYKYPYGNSSSYPVANRVTVRVTANPDPVSRGDELSYSIYVRNDTYSPRTVDVRAFLDPDTTFLAASNGGRETTNLEADWYSVYVAARSSMTLTLRTRVEYSANPGNIIRLRVDADGDSDDVTTRVDDSFRYRNPYGFPCSSYRGYGRYSYDYDGGRHRYGGDQFSLNVTGSPRRVEPGGQVRYSIVVRNDDSVGRYVDVMAFFDSGMSVIFASENGITSGNTVRWNALPVAANSSRTLSLTLYTDRAMRPGDLAHLRVTAGNAQDIETTSFGFPYPYSYGYQGYYPYGY
ncbi:hypothetical protein HY285_03600 [Candidatus Peregrinibacteria bacterium]|nr:hypothetical protein [Candidatus Peregrinibacteria bacterium]MBI3816600.1 hypothetical protein [Candidatus Peregrinibacteria bacterium]